MKLNKQLSIISALLIACATPLVAMETPTSNTTNTEQTNKTSGPSIFNPIKMNSNRESAGKAFLRALLTNVAQVTRNIGPAVVDGKSEQVREEFNGLDELEQVGFGLGVAVLAFGLYKYSSNIFNGLFAFLKAFGVDGKSFDKGQKQATDEVKEEDLLQPFFTESREEELRRENDELRKENEGLKRQPSPANNNAAGNDAPALTNQ